MSLDTINALFEGAGACLTWMNVVRVCKDKGYAGVYLPAVILFMSWGFWNLFYYPRLNQPWSFVATLIMVSANASWVIAMAYYGRKRQ
jgi:hypothetical protein